MASLQDKQTKIKDIRPGRKHLNINCIVIDTKSIVFVKSCNNNLLILLEEVFRNKENESLFSIWIGDASGSIILSIWGDMYQHIQSGDMLKIRDG
jgi:hypothetical protein